MKIPTDQYVVFRESQQYRQGWLWILLIFSSTISILPLLVLTVMGEMEIKEGLSALAAVSIILFLNIAAFYFTRFETVITKEGLYYRWWPFFPKYSFISVHEIATVQTKRWPYWKWGFVKNKEFGRCHTVDGDKGIQIVLKNGNKIYIGTQQLLSFNQAVLNIVDKKMRA